MFRVSKVLAPALLVAGVVGAAAVVAQPPDRKRPDDKQPDRKGPDDKGRPGGERPQPKADAAVEAWVKVLAEKIADPHDTVRDSARAALAHVGREAIPALRKLAEGDDAVKAVAARNVIAMIERGGQPGQPGGPFAGRPGPGRPGEPGDPARPGGPGERLDPLARVIGGMNLPEATRDKARTIIEGYAKKMAEFGEKVRNGKVDPADARAELDKVRGELMKDLKEALTDEQFKQLERLLQPRPPERPERE